MICNRDVEVTCKTSNVVYLIECNKCHVQYVGESGQELSSRVSDHKTRLYKHDATKKETVLIRHFHRGACKDALFSIRIVEVCEGEARKGPGKPLDPDVTRKRKRVLMAQAIYFLVQQGSPTARGTLVVLFH